MWKEFQEFAFKGDLLDLAIGLILGAAAGMWFAALESMGYAFTAFLSSQGSLSATVNMTLLRGILAPIGHGTWTAILASVLFREGSAGHFRIIAGPRSSTAPNASARPSPRAPGGYNRGISSRRSGDGGRSPGRRHPGFRATVRSNQDKQGGESGVVRGRGHRGIGESSNRPRAQASQRLRHRQTECMYSCRYSR